MSPHPEALAKALTTRQAGCWRVPVKKKVVCQRDPAWLRVFIARSSRWPLVVDSVIFAFGVS